MEGIDQLNRSQSKYRSRGYSDYNQNGRSSVARMGSRIMSPQQHMQTSPANHHTHTYNYNSKSSSNHSKIMHNYHSNTKPRSNLIPITPTASYKNKKFTFKSPVAQNQGVNKLSNQRMAAMGYS